MSLTDLSCSLDDVLTLPPVPSSFLNCSFLDSSVDDSNFVPSVPFAKSDVFSAEIKSADILTRPTCNKATVKLTFEIQAGLIDYLPGDTIGILPQNPCEEVERLLDLLNLSDSWGKCCSISSTKKTFPIHLPKRASVGYILTNCVDIRAPLKKLFIRSLAESTNDETEKRRLLELCSKECSQDYTDFILNESLTIAKLLESFKTCKPQFNLILEHLPRLQPRVYSIASSPLGSKTSISIVFNQVNRPDGSPGICSNYLYQSAAAMLDLNEAFDGLTISKEQQQKAMSHRGPSVLMYLRVANSFRIPKGASSPLILIGPGTGIAPFIGFLEHRKHLKESSTLCGPCWLFFGCRDEDHFIFKDQITGFLVKDVVTRFFLSYSRQTNEDGDPKYVQDNMLLVQEEFIEFLLTADCRLYICGDAKNMVKDVLAAVKTCFTNVKGVSEYEAESIVQSLMKDEKILTDAWI